ncbi:MAG: DUF5331 domain-containing protein [Cyanobacteria bacterium P01_A01_bin.84]
MAFFYSFTDSLKQKWINFYQANRDWIMLHMEVESVYTSDGGKRPPSYLILGVVNALEPKLAQLMFPFSKLNIDADHLVEVLDLNFDPEMALGNRIIPPVETENNSDTANLLAEEETQQAADMSQLESFDSGSFDSESFDSGSFNSESFDAESFDSQSFDSQNIQNDLDLGESADETLMVTDELEKNHTSSENTSFDGISMSSDEEQNSFGDVAQEKQDQKTKGQEQNQSSESSEDEVIDAFGDISFDDGDDMNPSEEKIDYEMLGDMNVSNDEDNSFGNVLIDVWGEESSVPESETNAEALNGEENSENAFDDTDIARLFPNS